MRWRAMLVLAAMACNDGGGEPGPPDTAPPDAAPPDAAPPPAFEADHRRWLPLAAGVPDPFLAPGATHPGPCPPDTWRYHDVEDDFEVNTEFCHFLTVEQALPEAMPAGAMLSIRLWHGRLWTSDPDIAEGTAGVAVADRVVWTESARIPALGQLLEGEWTLDRDLPAGTMLRYHVENHGDNRWSLLDVRIDL